MIMNTLIDDGVVSVSDHLTVIPVSVIDIGAQGKRVAEDHNTTSSRANYSPFPHEISTLCYEFYLKDKSTIFDPFAGWGERAFYAKKYNKIYTGYDISDVAIKKAYDDYGVTNLLMDSYVADIKPFDGLLTCPPYWNLEKYANVNGIDREKTFEDFITKLKTIFSKAYDVAEDGAVFCVMVGDWRKNHVYYDLEFETSKMFKEFGAKIIDKVVVSRSKVSKIKIMLPQAKRLGYSVRVHENLLVFKK